MSEVNVRLIDQNLIVTNRADIYSGDINTDIITFDFCDRWEGFVKTAIFYRSKDEVYQQLLNDDNTCNIPKEVLDRAGVICIGVYGVKDDQVFTSQVIRYRIYDGAVSSTLKIENPTLTVYEQIVSEYGEMVISQADFIENQERAIQEYRDAWLTEVETSIDDAVNASRLCMDAVSALQLEYRNMDGGTPTTEEELYDDNYNGGYPVNNN